MSIDFSFILVALRSALRYLPTTMMLTIGSLLLGVLAGFLLALVRYYKIPILATIVQWFLTILKGVPIVLLLLVSYLIISDYFDEIATFFHWHRQFKDVKREYIALFVLTISATVTLSEIFRGALLAIKPGQFDAAYAVGLTKKQTIQRIIIPQMIPTVLPMISNTLIGLLKASALVSLIMVTDVLNGALLTATTNYNFLEAYIAAALIYWGMSVLIEKSAYLLEHYYTHKLGGISR